MGLTPTAGKLVHHTPTPPHLRPACSPVMASSIGNDTPKSPGGNQQRMRPAANGSTDQDEDGQGGRNGEEIQHNHSLGSKIGEDSYPSSPTGEGVSGFDVLYCRVQGHSGVPPRWKVRTFWWCCRKVARFAMLESAEALHN